MLGYIKVGAAIPKLRVADCRYNAEQILGCIKKAAAENVKLLVFPELSLSGYTCGDLFFQARLISECEKAAVYIMEKSVSDIVALIGAPVLVDGALYNCAVAIHAGKILGIVPKMVLAEGGEFYEKRWFKSGAERSVSSVMFCGANVPFGNIIFKCGNYKHFSFASELCADLWSIFPPSGVYAQNGATVIANLSASPACAGKTQRRLETVKEQSLKCRLAYIYCGSSIGESSSDNVYDGQALIAALGKIAAESDRYSDENEIITAEVDAEDFMLSRAKAAEAGLEASLFGITTVNFNFIEPDNILPQVIPPRNPYVSAENAGAFYQEIFDIQTFGLYKRLAHTGISRSIIGVSGGVDSTLALLVAVNSGDKLCLPRESILGITMPGLGTSGRTYDNSVKLMKALNISWREISIKDACVQHFKDIGHGMGKTDAAFENAQARERTQILMDIANMENGLVIGTGDMSELALGWATYNGDHMSMYGVNAGVPKTIIRGLLGWLADNNRFSEDVTEIICDVLATPVSPELLPTGEKGEITQKTEDLVGPYELHDFFLYYSVHKCFSPEKTAFLAKCSFAGVYGDEEILKWQGVFYRRFFSQQFKRSCSPDYPKALEFGLSRGTDLKIPSDASGAIWLTDGAY